MKFAIVIPTYNHCDDLLKPCIASIIQNTKRTDEVEVDLIIVANGCTDNTYEYLQALQNIVNLPFTLHVIWEDKPLGYTKAVNRGIIKSIELNSHYTILMNNDVTLLDFASNNRWLEILNKPFRGIRTGMVGTSKIIDETTGVAFIIFYMAMIKTSIFSEIGLLDEIFNPGFGEDIDFSIRLQRSGYNIIRVPVEGVGYDYTETFPLYHGAEKTMHDEKSDLKGVFGLSWEEVIARNKQILKDRYVSGTDSSMPSPLQQEPEPPKSVYAPTYTIIIPTTGDYANKLDVCLDSLREVTDVGKDVQLIIVANGVTDETKKYIEDIGNQMKMDMAMVYSEAPLGFPVAINEGIRHALGKYIILLNDDVVFLPQPKNEWIDILRSPFDNMENVGVTGLKKIGSSFAKQDYLMFFCTMISRELIDKIGVLDHHFSPAWVEDEEYCLRATQAGYKIVEIPSETYEFERRSVQMYHRSSATLNNFDEKRKIVKRNRYYMLNKYFPNDLVNIVIATYNRHTELRRALESVEKQTYDKIKVWVCADGHDPEVQKIVEEFDYYSDNKKYIYLHLQQHEGLIGSKPRMMGIDAIADTGVVCFLDDDNILYPTYVEKLFNLMQTDEANVISYCTIIHSHAPNPIPLPGHVPGFFEISNIDTLNVMIKSSVAKKCKLKWQHIKGQRITHDFDFINECGKHGKSAYLSEVLAEHCMSLNKVDGNNPEEAAITAPRITIGIVRHNEENFQKYLQPSLAALTNKNYDVIVADDTKMPAENYNYIINQSTNDYILFVHEDVEFSPNFLDRIWATIVQNPNFGVLGIEGGRHTDDLTQSIKYEWADLRASKKLTTLDSSCFLINKKHNLFFDAQTFDQLHGYSEDYCMQVQRNLGLGCYTILTNAYPSNWKGYYDANNYVKHQAVTCNTVGYNWGDFTIYFNKLIEKWKPEVPKSPKIYDCFQFYNELDVLDIRFNTLYDYVDKFVLVEARFTHQGKPKPLYFEENKERYAKFLDKIEHIVLDEMVPLDDPYITGQKGKQHFRDGNQHWMRERYQRDMMMRAWTNCDDNDIIIISDADEIINPEVLKTYTPSMGYCSLIQRLFYYKLNCEIMVPWDKARIMPYSFIKDKYPSDVRCDLDEMVVGRIPNAGWHFSYLYSTPEEISDKIQSFCHAELNTQENVAIERIKGIVERGEDLYGRGHKMEYVPIDINYPKYVLDNEQYFTERNLIKPIVNPNSHEEYKAFNKDLYVEIFEQNLYNTQKEEIENKIIVDLGANVGFFSIRCSEMGAKQIYAFEPEQNNYNQMLKFIEGRENIKPYKLAILDGSKNSVHVSNAGVLGNIWGSNTDEEVPCVGLEMMMGLLFLHSNDLVLKLDVEGSEYEIIFNTPVDKIRQFETIYLEVHPTMNPNYQNKDKELRQYIQSLGYIEVPQVVATGWWDNEGHFNKFDDGVFKYKRVDDSKTSNIEEVKNKLKELDLVTYDEIFKVKVYQEEKEEIENAVVVDIGANFGCFSIRAIELGAKEVLSFEPENSNYKMLTEITQGFPKIKPMKFAVSDGAVSKIHMISDKVTSNVWGNDNGEEVPVMSLVDVVSHINSSDNKAVLKVDCEGSEYEILLHTPADVIRKFSHIYLEIHEEANPNFQWKSNMLVDYIKFLGYDAKRGPQAGTWLPDGGFKAANVCMYKFTRRPISDTIIPKKQVYDCFMFNDELDILDIRLAELNDVVDYFVIVESNFTHSGKPKPLYFKENEQRYAKYLSKIRHYIYDYPLETDNAWHRESHQRDACAQGLYDANDYDVIISGDADEIPKKEVIANYDPRKGVVGVETKYYFYFLNCRRQDKGTTHMRLIPYHILKPYTFCFFRYKDYPMIENGGWHFSFIGDVKQIQKKFDSYAHQEYNNEHFTNTERLTKMINAGEDILEKGMKFDFVEIDETFPKYLMDNKEYYIKNGNIKIDALKKRQVYDCFLFYNELDLLELRLNELNDVVDKFVLVEADITFTGKPKPFYYEENKERFATFNEKIIHIKVENIPPMESPWDVEEYQRDYIMKGIEQASIDDVIIISDVDEIPNPSVIRNFDASRGINALQQKMTYYYFNCMADNMWFNAKIGTKKDVQSLPPSDVRRLTGLPVIFNGGWHFTYTGGIKNIIDKLEAFSHQEYNNEYIKNPYRIFAKMDRGEDLFDREFKYAFVEIDETFPKYILNRKTEYISKQYIKPIIKYSIVIPTYNHCDDLLKPCIESIIQNTIMDNVEIIVIANGCTDNTKEYLEGIKDINLRMLWYDEPLGYTVATNKGIREAIGKYIILLNNDIVILPYADKNTWINLLEEPFKEDALIGVSGPIRLYHYPHDYDFISFACAMIPKKIIETIGLLDENFNPGYAEDDDYALRLKENGYKIKQVPAESFEYSTTFPIYHVSNATIKTALPDYIDIQARNTKLLLEKHKHFLDAIQFKSSVSENVSTPKEPSKPIRLHLNCGDDIFGEYVNCDESNPKADMICGILDLPFPDESIDEILVHIPSNQFFTKEYKELVNKMHKMLKPNGEIAFVAPMGVNNPEYYLNFKTYKTA